MNRIAATLVIVVMATPALARDMTLDAVSQVRLMPNHVTQLVTEDARGRHLLSLRTAMTKVLQDVPEGGTDRIDLVEVRRDEPPFVDAAAAYVHVRHLKDVVAADATHQYHWVRSGKAVSCYDGAMSVPDFACP